MDPPPTVVAHRAGLARAAGAGEKRPAKMTAANQRGGNGNGAKRWTNNDGSSTCQAMVMPKCQIQSSEDGT